MSTYLSNWVDRLDFPLTTFKNRHTKQGELERLKWSELAKRLGDCTITSETEAEYRAMHKSQQGEIKDVGGFVGAITQNGKREKASIQQRSLLTLDADKCQPEDIASIEAKLKERDLAYILYTTHSHTRSAPRFRLVLPLCPTITPEDYTQVAGAFANWLSPEAIDACSISPSQLMYYPSASVDAEFIHRVGEGKHIVPDEWIDEAKGRFVEQKHQRGVSVNSANNAPEGRSTTDPREKPHYIGAFCRAYSIEEAISVFLSDVYKPAGRRRYTYMDGDGFAGLHILDDCFAYSFHSTDPAVGTACNAFDLVRIHKFGHLDSDSSQRIEKRPSFTAMCKFVQEDPKAKEELLAEVVKDFDDEETSEAGWRSALMLRAKTGRVEPTRFNILLILQHDPTFKGKLRKNTFTGRCEWWGNDTPEQWTDTRDAWLRMEIERKYGISNKQAVEDAFLQVCEECQYDPIKEIIEGVTWDGVPRIDSLYIDYLGAEDTPLMRAFARKMFIAGVARTYKPGTKFDYITVLTGAEGAGKSTLIRKLSEPWFNDSLPTLENREAVAILRTAWFVEMAELNALKKSDIEAVKAFISKTVDEYRPAYGRNTITVPRRCIFFATTNEWNFMRNEGGNRRFWVVPIRIQEPKAYPWDLEADTIRQMWAEAKHYYDQGERCELPADLSAEAEGLRLEHEEIDPLKQKVIDLLLTPVPNWWYQQGKTFRSSWLEQHRKTREGGNCTDFLADLEVDQTKNEYGVLSNPGERTAKTEGAYILRTRISVPELCEEIVPEQYPRQYSRILSSIKGVGTGFKGRDFAYSNGTMHFRKVDQAVLRATYAE